MIVYRRWLQQSPTGALEWEREGWYLFGLVPLLIRDRQVRGRFGRRLER